MMRCPECQSLHEPADTVCGQCGLIFAALPQPHRREEDRSHQKRRAADANITECPACGGSVPTSAIRCRHCSEILDRGYLARKARRRRAQVNAASWISYLLGLATLFIFRPVGVIAIGVGLALSILYYLIPVEEELPYEDARAARDNEDGDAPEDGPFHKLAASLRRQFEPDRFILRVPKLPRLKMVFIGTPLIAAAIGIFANYFFLQIPMTRVVSTSDAFKGVGVSAHYRYWIIPGVVVYDVKAERDADLGGALMELARKSGDPAVAEIHVMVEGRDRGKLSGETFRRIATPATQADRRSLSARIRRVFNADDETGEDFRDRELTDQRASQPATTVTIPVSR